MNPLEGDEQQYRVIVALAAVLAGCAVIGVLTFALPWPEAVPVRSRLQPCSSTAPATSIR